MTLLLNNLTLSADEQERVAALHHTYGFEVLNTGVSGVTADERSVVMCYWVCKRGVRQSAVFTNHEAAWRDALRVHEEAVDAVKANPGVHRVAQHPQSQELSVLKGQLKKANYHFTDLEWTHKGMTVGGHESHADTIRSAVRHWAKNSPDAFIAAMGQMGSRVITAATDMVEKVRPAEESKELSYLKRHAEAQGYTFKKGSIGEGQCWVFQGMTEGGHDTHAMAVRGAIKHWARRDPESFCKAMNLLGEGAEPELLHHDTPVPTFEEDPHRSKRVYGLVEGSPEAVQIRHLEAIGYEFFFTSTSGWVCKQIDRTVACGALMTVVKTAWEMAVSENGAAWQGVGQPPPGTTLWVIPHNTLWGFDLVDTYLCEVLAYHNDHVWLQLLSDTGEVVLGKYITTRIDKVDVKVWKGNNDA